jgi:hypothetical protein
VPQLTVLDKVLGHLVILLAHQLEVQGSTIAHLIINIIQTSCEKDLDAALHIGILLSYTKLRKRCDGGGTNNCVLEDHTVVDVANILGGLDSLGTLETNQVQNANSKLSELAILDKFAQMGKRLLLRVGDELDQIEHALNHGALKVVTTFVTQDSAKESEHAGLLAREFEAQSADGLDNRNLELISDLRHEARDLLHEAVNACFVTGLKKSCDGESGDRTVAVRDEEFDVGVADIDSVGLEGGEVVEDTEGGKLGDGAGRGQEELENVNSISDLSIGDVPHVTNSLRCLEVDHLALVSEPAIEKLHHGLAEGSVLFRELGSKSDEHDEGSRALDRTSGAELLHHLDQRHTVVRAHLVQKTDGMVLRHCRVVHRDLATR